VSVGGAALSLAFLGLFGTISNAIKRRTAELGIRVALGADRRAVQWLIVREATAAGDCSHRTILPLKPSARTV
jgi:ABC-type antimicrobial peptide transport system permease subunit